MISGLYGECPKILNALFYCLNLVSFVFVMEKSRP